MGAVSEGPLMVRLLRLGHSITGRSELYAQTVSSILQLIIMHGILLVNAG